jgi:hypothetical protein
MNQNKTRRKITATPINRSRSPSPAFLTQVNANNTSHINYTSNLPNVGKAYSVRKISNSVQSAFTTRPLGMKQAINVEQQVNYIPPQLLVSNTRIRPTSITIGKKTLPRYSKTSRQLIPKNVRNTRKSRKSRRTRKSRY